MMISNAADGQAQNPAPVPSNPPANLKPSMIIVSLGIAVIAVYLILFSSGQRTRPLAPPFVGHSTQLSKTQIVPVLNVSLDNTKNVIWCASFQMAWDRMCKNITQGPAMITGAETWSALLNQESFGDTPPMADESYYAEAGLVAEGVINTINRAMGSKFPGVQVPIFAPEARLVAYSYLEADIHFQYPYFEKPRALPFVEKQGQPVEVAAWGIGQEIDSDNFHRIVEQAKILYSHSVSPGDPLFPPDEFIIDPDSTSSPYQIILARVPSQPTLRQTLEYTLDRASGIRPETQSAADSPSDLYNQPLGMEDNFWVPMLRYRVTHRFTELCGSDKLLILKEGNTGVRIDTYQMIQFKLNQSGAELKSESELLDEAAIPTNYIFDRPFIIIMQWRGQSRPFFVMWVGNSELLSKYDQPILKNS
ncbi:MAG: hypothetical protein HJJLKODD_02510 [Phycisphaerae bacterium]|nr:hypothetical protein [Phycisphaerae bacterium]